VELSHTFTVPATVDQAWATFMDLPLVGGCFPGATVTEVTEEGFAGTVKVKLGPIALVYSGTGAFVERDDGAHRAVIEAKGKDKRGNGTAGATVTIQLTDAGDGSTRADVQTDLAVTGKPAQFGRGVMQDVSDKLLGQFIGCIEGKIGDAQQQEAQGGAVAAAPAPTAEVAPPAGAEAASDTPVASSAPIAPTTPVPTTPVPTTAVPTTAVPPAPSRETSAQPEAALDLGSTVLPVLLKAYGKQIAVGVVAVVAVIVVWRAMSG
jgi:carbon monoxide dehydrogenase subunit G